MSFLINSGGTWKDVTGGGGGTEITSGTATCTRTITTVNYCKWVKSGHIVMVDIRTYFGDNTGNRYMEETFSGLPKPYIEIYLEYKRSVYCSKYSNINDNGNTPFPFEYKLTVDGNIIVGGYFNNLGFRDYFTYISSE